MKTLDDPQLQPPPPTGSRRALRQALVGATALVLLAAVVGSFILFRGAFDSGSQPGLDPTDPAAAPSAPASTTPAAAPADLAVVARQLVELDYQLRVHPDPALVAKLMDVSNPAYADAASTVNKLATGEVRYDPLPAPFDLASVSVLRQDATTATVQVGYGSWPAFRAVDRNGGLVLDSPAGGPRTVVFTLRLRDGQWRLANSERLS